MLRFIDGSFSIAPEQFTLSHSMMAATSTSNPAAITMTSKVTRRDFVRAASATLLAAPLAAAAQKQSESKTDLPIIDTHQHLWDLTKFKLPWIGGEWEQLGKNYTLADYWKAADSLGIVKTIYMEVAVESAQQEAEADYVVALCKNPETKMVKAVVAGQPASETFAAYVAKLKKDRRSPRHPAPVVRATRT